MPANRCWRNRIAPCLCMAVLWLLNGCSRQPPAATDSPSAPDSTASSSQAAPSSERGAETSPSGTTESRISESRWAELEQQKTLGVASLENARLAEAEQIFTQIAAAVPFEHLGLQNLLIARMLAVESGEAEASQLTEVFTRFQNSGRSDVVFHILSGRAHQLSGRTADAVAAFQKASQAASDDASVFYEQSLAGRTSRDPKIKESAREALTKAFELQPGNLFLLTERLLDLAAQKDSSAAAMLEAARPQLKWLAESIRMQNQLDLMALVEKARTSAANSDWATLTGNIRILNNVLRPQPAVQSDRLRVQRHLLEFVLRDFQDPAATADQAEREPTAVQNEVSFRLLALPDAEQSPQSIVGCEIADWDLNGTPDLIVLRDNTIRVSSFDSIAKAETLTSPPATVLLSEWTSEQSLTGIVVADLDQDLVDLPKPAEPAVNIEEHIPVCHAADPDVIVYGPDGMTVLRNVSSEQKETTGNDGAKGPDGTSETAAAAPGSVRHLELVEQSAEFQAVRQVNAVSIADLDHDGDLDLAISSSAGISLWLNRGDLTFFDITANSLMPPLNMSPVSFLPIDWDRDLDIDLLAATITGSSGYLENVAHGRFRWHDMNSSDEPPVKAANLAAAGHSIRRSWDLFRCGPDGASVTESMVQQPGVVRLETVLPISGAPVEELDRCDFDNDGVSDVVVRSGSELKLFQGGMKNQRLASFREVTTFPGSQFGDPEKSVTGAVRGVRVTDLDRDGDQDLIVAGTKGIASLINIGGNQNHWLKIALRGEQEKGGQVSASGRVNHYGIGSLIEVRSGSHYQALTSEFGETHFGLGQRVADVARVVWTNGVPANVIHPKPDTQICELQTLKGSCPYLYTRTEKGIEFFTDLLWSAPLGLQFAEGVYAAPRAWEYLRLPGDRLAAVNGEYHLMVTEELWEAAYFDQIELLAVDHPVDTEIYTNEKVGPAVLAEHRIHTVTNPRLPVAAHDQNGRDILERLKEADGRYVKAFDQRIRQGLTEPHFIELALGALQNPEKITLFLTGWIFPTDTSINVALGQSQTIAGPRPPSLQVPDGDGQWKEVMPFMGFPGGKTKTIAVDLSGLFTSNDYRVRILTSAEICWDAAFFTVDEPEVPVQVTPVTLRSADLHYRGFSARIPDLVDFGPETMDYRQLERGYRWAPMEGMFTRYGDVLELLAEVDDRLVVMGSGDEITLKFAVPDAELPAGWKRDFILHNTGWDKDADLNTVYGQTVEPLPFNSMSGYPWKSDETPMDSESYQEYLRRYQTRRQSHAGFRSF
ncbi:MAG: FG-GAP-like repeat-containing protein [Planctomyces sp.]